MKIKNKNLTELVSIDVLEDEFNRCLRLNRWEG